MLTLARHAVACEAVVAHTGYHSSRVVAGGVCGARIHKVAGVLHCKVKKETKNKIRHPLLHRK